VDQLPLELIRSQPSTIGSATSSNGLPPERSRMFEQLDFVSQPRHKQNPVIGSLKSGMGVVVTGW